LIYGILKLANFYTEDLQVQKKTLWDIRRKMEVL